VPEAIVRSTHKKVSDTFPKAVAAGYFDKATVWSSATRGNPVLLASADGKSLSIIDNEGYSEFVAKAGE
jgi:hypothetical protein